MEGDYRSVPAGYEFGQAARDFPEWRHRIWNACVYAMVDLVDEQVGRILGALEQTGLAENTIVVFTTDHGDYMGNHSFWFKGPFHYDDVVRLPLIVRYPGGAAGVRTQAMASLIDLAPTFLESAGFEAPAAMDGRSLLPVLQGRAERIRNACVIESRATRTGLYAQTIVSERYKATFYGGQSYGELYDLAEDPDEFVNRWDDPALANVRFELALRLLTEHMGTEQNVPRRIGYA